MNKIALFTLLLCTNVAISQNLGCLMIDFEEISNDSLFEGKEISNQFEAEFGLTFQLESGGHPVLAQIGDPLTAFSSGFGNDTPRPEDAAAIGQYFLTDDGDWIETADPIILNFSTPIDSFAGCILDMDGGEIFYIDAYDDIGNIILQDSIMAGEPNTGDGVATCWGFNLMGCEGTVYQIKFSGFRPGGTFGMGLDNLSFCYSGISVELNLTQPSCSGDEDGIIEVVSTDGVAYTYSLDGVNFSQNGLFTGLEPDSYDVFVMDPNGCMTSYDVSLQSSGSNSSGFIEEVICPGDSTIINNEVYNTAGSFNQILVNDAGCDSTLSIFINELESFEVELNELICLSDTLILNGISYSETGQYTQSLMTFEGCDSSIIINLEVVDVNVLDIMETICSGDTFELNGFTYDESGFYEQELATVNGCDSLINLTLIVEEVLEGVLTESVCEGDSILINGAYYSIAGTYTQSLQTAAGCDSLLNLSIDILPNYEINQSYILTTGQSIDINGLIYTEPGSYEQLLTTGNGCDSTIIITITPPLIECEDPCVGFVPIQEIELSIKSLSENSYNVQLKNLDQKTEYVLSIAETFTLLDLLDVESELGIDNHLLNEIHSFDKFKSTIQQYTNTQQNKSVENKSAFYTDHFNTAHSTDEISNVFRKVHKQNTYLINKINQGGTIKKCIRHRALKSGY